MAQSSTSRAGSEQPKRAIRPSASRTTSSSKVSQKSQKAAVQEPSPACCSEAGEVVLICCDSPDCVAEDVPVCPSDAGGVADDCIECLQAAETGCSGDCITGAVTDADDCPACAGAESTAVTETKSQECLKPARILSASDAFDAEEPIQACDVPGCSALEWDEKAVDELLRCCCNGSDHHHESFAIPSHVPARSHSHIAQHQHNQLQYQHQHVPQIAPAEHQTPQSTFLAPHQHAFRTHHHYHAHPTEPQYTVNHAAPHLHNSSSVSNTSIPSASASLLSSFLHAGPGYAQNYLAQPSNGPAGHHEIGGSHGSNFLPSPINHSRSHSLPTTAGAQFPPPNMESSPAPAATVAFHCEWSSCSASFPSREELVGHVTVTHLLQVKALTTKSECAPPTPAHSHISSVNRLSETRDGTNNSTQTSQILPNATANMFPSIGHLHFGQSGQANGNVFGDIQNQPTDASFDHTLRCLWDSCEASLPILGDSTGHLPHSDTTLNHQAPSHTHANSVGTADMSHSHGSFQGLPDQSTASLVRHLLQDHLHLPTDVLGQLSPGLPIVPTTGQHGSSANVSGKDGLSQYGSSYMSSGPISSHSTPHSTSGVPSYSTLQSPATYKPPPTPPIASADQQFKFDFGLSGIPNFSSYSTHSEQDRQQPAHQALPMPQSNESSESHSCKWKGCRSTFANTAELMEHISTDHIGSGKSMYYCEWDDCDRAHEGRGFNQRQKVMRHVRTHVGDKPFICSECGRAFSESTTMAQHMRTHTNEKPFECPEPGCGKTFALQSALTIHMRVHTGEKPFKCPNPGCGMAFAESSNLSKHVKTHLPRARVSSQDSTITNSSRGKKRRYTSATDLDDAPYVDASVKMLKA